MFQIPAYSLLLLPFLLPILITNLFLYKQKRDHYLNEVDPIRKQIAKTRIIESNITIAIVIIVSVIFFIAKPDIYGSIMTAKDESDLPQLLHQVHTLISILGLGFLSIMNIAGLFDFYRMHIIGKTSSEIKSKLIQRIKRLPYIILFIIVFVILLIPSSLDKDGYIRFNVIGIVPIITYILSEYRFFIPSILVFLFFPPPYTRRMHYIHHGH